MMKVIVNLQPSLVPSHINVTKLKRRTEGRFDIFRGMKEHNLVLSPIQLFTLIINIYYKKVIIFHN